MPETSDAALAEIVKSLLERDHAEWPALLSTYPPETRAEVESLLSFQDRAENFLDQSAERLAAEMMIEGGTLRPGERVQHYLVESLIGTGGMGEVYLASDTELKRQVALKLVQRGMNTQTILRRFRHEEEILAGLNHPNIAQLYGTGTTADGVPFFAMEYVAGEPVDQFCRQRALGLVERLQLFSKICGAVSYAHQHLVIHRDLKPANIRVTDEGEPKLLDFGIAKLIDAANADGLEHTLTLPSMMTPEYASPEQVRGQRVTTASDIYSLGVLLYELLTEQKPYRLTSRSPEEISRTIAEQEPTRPSAIIREKPPSAFRTHKLKGDLDNIVLMALRKEPERRYRSASQLAEDIYRYLHELPVVARKDTVGYRTSKFLRRHLLGVSAASVVAVAVLGALVLTSWEARVARAERDRARDEKNKAEAIDQFLQQMLNRANPLLRRSAVSGEVTIAEALDEAATLLQNGRFSGQPSLRADLEEIIARSYNSQGKYALAAEHLRTAFELHRQMDGPTSPKSLSLSTYLAVLTYPQRDPAEVEQLFRRALPLLRQYLAQGRISASTMAEALNNFACLRRTQGDSREAEALFRETLALARQLTPDARYALGPTRSTLASTLADQAKSEEALRTARAAVAEYVVANEAGTPNYGFAVTVLAGFLVDREQYVEASAHLREAEQIFRSRLGPNALWLGDNLRNQAIASYRQGNYEEALKLAREATDIYSQSFGGDYDHYPTALLVEGLSLTRTGHAADGEKIVRQAVRLRHAKLPPSHYWVAVADSCLGECLMLQGRYAEAEPLLTASYNSLKERRGENDPVTIQAQLRVAELNAVAPAKDR